MRAGLVFAAATAALSVLGAGARSLASDPPPVVARARAVAKESGAAPRRFTSTATVTCTAESFYSTFADLADNYTAAIDHAVAVVCARDWDGNYTEAAEAMKNFTLPIGKVLASTKASCSTSVVGTGYAQGCAHVETSGLDFEAALVDTHVKAAAAAYDKHCMCAKKWKWDFGDADMFSELVGAAYNDTDLLVCASGNEVKTEEAFVECFATIIADTFAYGAATSAADAGCYRGYYNEAERKAVEEKTATLELECKVPDEMMAKDKAKAAPKAAPKVVRKPAPTPKFKKTVTIERSAKTEDDDGSVEGTVKGTGTVTRGGSGGVSVKRTINIS